jgi:hypothetical protein
MTSLPKPTITPTSATSWSIDFHNGATGTMTRVPESPRDRWDWTVAFSDGRTFSSHAYGDRLAFECAWCQAAQVSAPPDLGLTEFEVRRLVQIAKEQRKATAWAKALRNVLKRRTGRSWSVRVGTGTSGEWLYISAPPKRRVGGDMSAHDTALLAATLGREHVSNRGVSVSPDRRESVLSEIVGPVSARGVA